MLQSQELVRSGRMLTAKELMTMLHLSRTALWRLSNSKSAALRIPSYKVGGKRLYNYDQVIHYLDSHKTAPNGK